MTRYLQLVIESEDGRLDRVTIGVPESGSPPTLGSDEACDLRLEHAAARQCQLALDGTDLILTDLDPEGRTRCNGAPIVGRLVVDHGDEIEFGGLKLTVDLDVEPPADEGGATRDDEPSLADETEAEVQAFVELFGGRREEAPGGVTEEPAVEASTEADVRPSSHTPEETVDESPTEASPALAADPVETPSPSVSREPGAEIEAPPAVSPPAAPPASSPPAVPPPAESPPAESPRTPPAPRHRPTPIAAAGRPDVVATLTAEFPEQAAAHDPVELSAIVARSIERAQDYGLTEDEHLLAFLRIVIMLDDELAGRHTPFVDVWYSLTNLRQPPAARLQRADILAKRALERRARSARAQEAASAAPPPPPAPPAPPAPRPVRPSAPAVPETPASPSASPPAPAPTAADGSEDVTSARDASDATHPTKGLPPPRVEEGILTSTAVPEIEGFEMLGRIEEGGMGMVYRALDLKLDVEVAIKVIRSLGSLDQDQLLREARAAARLRHPNIVQVHQYEEHDEVGYYVMEFVPGRDARRLIADLRAEGAPEKSAPEICAILNLEPSELGPELRAALDGPGPYYRLVAWWMAGIAEGLALAHREGIFHRDIKPSNLLLATDGRLKIADFGVATRHGDIAHGLSSRIGTPRYLAPERVADWACDEETSPADGRIDIWSLGATLYEFLALDQPFKGPEKNVLREIVTTDPPPLSGMIWNVPGELEAVCLKAMARNPRDRYPRADQMGEELRAWIESRRESRGFRLFPWRE